MARINRSSEEACPDCGVRLGTQHKRNCDVAHCMACGGQFFSCQCDRTDSLCLPGKWTGEWPGIAEAERMGLWTRWDKERNKWVKCGPGDEGARADLNALLSLDGIYYWDRSAQEWRRR